MEWTTELQKVDCDSLPSWLMFQKINVYSLVCRGGGGGGGGGIQWVHCVLNDADRKL